MSDMDTRYSSVEELLAVAQRDHMVVRSNSLAGVFKWTPKEFELQRAEGKFPARCDACNFWLEPIAECLEGLRREAAEKHKEFMEIKTQYDKFLDYAYGPKRTR